MRLQIFFSGGLAIALGVYGRTLLDSKQAWHLMLDALLLGSSVITCGLLSLKWRWHGIAAAGMVSLVGIACGIGNLKGFAHLLRADPDNGGAFSVLKFGLTVICLTLLAKCLVALQKERLRRTLEPEQPD